MAKTQARIYKVVNHTTGNVRLVMSYNKWQATEFVARNDYSCDVCKSAEAVSLYEQGIKIEYAVKDK